MLLSLGSFIIYDRCVLLLKTLNSGHLSMIMYYETMNFMHTIIFLGGRSNSVFIARGAIPGPWKSRNLCRAEQGQLEFLR